MKYSDLTKTLLALSRDFHLAGEPVVIVRTEVRYITDSMWNSTKCEVDTHVKLPDAYAEDPDALRLYASVLESLKRWHDGDTVEPFTEIE